MRRMGKRIVVVVVAALLLSACGAARPPVTDPTRNLTPTGRAAYEATKVARVLDLLRDVAVSGEQQNPQVFSTAGTTKVVKAHEAAFKAMGDVPAGWRPIVDDLLTSLQKDLPANEWQQVAPFAALLRALLIQGVK